MYLISNGCILIYQHIPLPIKVLLLTSCIASIVLIGLFIIRQNILVANIPRHVVVLVTSALLIAFLTLHKYIVNMYGNMEKFETQSSSQSSQSGGVESESATQKMTNSFTRLGESLSKTNASIPSENSNQNEQDGKKKDEETIVLEEQTFSKYLNVGTDEQLDILMEEFPLDDDDPSFEIDVDDPYYDKDISRMKEEYPKVLKALRAIQDADPLRFESLKLSV